MPRLRILIVFGLWAGLVCGSTERLIAQTFKIHVPLRGNVGQVTPPFQISRSKFTITVVANPGVSLSNVGFSITSTTFPGALILNSSTPNSTGCSNDPQDPSATIVGCSNFTTFPSGANQPDVVTIYRPFQDPSIDANRYQRYEIDIEPLTDQNITGSPLACRGTTVPPRDYTVQVTVTPTAGVQVFGVCLESYDPHSPTGALPQCRRDGASFVLPLTDLAQASLLDAAGNSIPFLQCFKQRPLADAILVLDKSGSMASRASNTATEDKIVHLQKAVKDFVSAWHTARSTEPTITSPTPDQIGVALFDETATPWIGPTGLTSSPLLNNFGSVDSAITSFPCTETACGNLVPNTSTSIGAGLIMASSAFTSDGNKPVILLMTDGMQNTDPKIKIVGNQIRVYCESAASPCTLPVACLAPNDCALPGSSNSPKIYTVTVGFGTGVVDDSIIQPIATNSGGFYINTETDAGLLRPFFLELLQNILRFNSYETAKMISGKTTPFAMSIPLSVTTHDVEFSLMWPNNLGALRLTITPPGGLPIVRESASGFISIAQTLPLPAPFDPTGNWGVQVEVPPINTPTLVTTNGGGVSFDLHVMADDGAIKSDLSVVPGDYMPGDKIRLRAKLTQFGRPILGLGSHPGDKIMADLIEPGASIGDILSDSTSSSVPPSTVPDRQSAVETKLFNTLKEKPELFTHNSRNVTLFDDGNKSEHGDDVAGDGVYSALYQATLPGHYNFVFTIEGNSESAGRFTRQQIRTAYVRSVPDADNTVFQTSIVRRDNGNVLSILMTPRIKTGPGCPKTDPKRCRMGLGWTNYFWFTTPGQPPFKATDNLNGTYTATLAFTGSKPPKVSVHFENVLAVIGDSVTPDQLPQPLGPGNVFIADVTAEKCFGRSVSANVLLFFGTGAFLVGLAVYRPWRRRKQS